MEKSEQDDRRKKTECPREILETKIKQFMDLYEADKGKSPNMVILSTHAKETLKKAGLLNCPISISDVQGRDEVVGKDFQLSVYSTHELNKRRRTNVERISSAYPGTIYMGRMGMFWGIKKGSLEFYNLEVNGD